MKIMLRRKAYLQECFIPTPSPCPVKKTLKLDKRSILPQGMCSQLSVLLQHLRKPEPASCRFGSNPPRAFSWAPDRKVRFGTKAGGMEEAPPPNEFNAANLFLCRNPDLDLWNFLGLSPGADQRSIMAAWRRRSRALHPDKVAESEKAAKEEEFKMLCAAKDILLNPIMQVQYTQWRANRTRRDVPSHQAAPSGGPGMYAQPWGAPPSKAQGSAGAYNQTGNWLSDRPATAATSEAVLKCEASLPWL